MTTPTVADLVAQVERLTRECSELRSEIATLKTQPPRERDPEVDRLAALVPPGWQPGNLVSVADPGVTVTRDCKIGTWTRWTFGGVCEARGTLAEVTRDVAAGPGRKA